MFRQFNFINFKFQVKKTDYFILTIMDSLFSEPSASLAVCFFDLLDLYFLLSYAGGALGGAAGWWMTSDTFLPLHQIIMEMPPQQKKKLYSEVMAVLGKLDWVDLAQLMFLVMGNSSLQMRVLSTLISFATKDLGAKVDYVQK